MYKKHIFKGSDISSVTIEQIPSSLPGPDMAYLSVFTPSGAVSLPQMKLLEAESIADQLADAIRLQHSVFEISIYDDGVLTYSFKPRDKQ